MSANENPWEALNEQCDASSPSACSAPTLTEIARRLANTPSSCSAGTASTSASSTSSVGRRSSRSVPSCWWQWPFACGAPEPLPKSSSVAARESAEAWKAQWAQADELLEIENVLRKNIAGTNPSSLEAALRWATMTVGVDRDLKQMARKRLPYLRLRERLFQAMESGDSEMLEDVLSQACWVGLDAETLEIARRKLAELKLDWLPTRIVSANDLKASPDDSTATSQRECTICLGIYKEHDTQIFLPCCHRFHADCIKEWLIRRLECPVCHHNPYRPHHVALWDVAPWDAAASPRSDAPHQLSRQHFG